MRVGQLLDLAFLSVRYESTGWLTIREVKLGKILPFHLDNSYFHGEENACWISHRKTCNAKGLNRNCRA